MTNQKLGGSICKWYGKSLIYIIKITNKKSMRNMRMEIIYFYTQNVSCSYHISSEINNAVFHDSITLPKHSEFIQSICVGSMR
jgi:hypothetical protein